MVQAAHLQRSANVYTVSHPTLCNYCVGHDEVCLFAREAFKAGQLHAAHPDSPADSVRHAAVCGDVVPITGLMQQCITALYHTDHCSNR